jgi:hypothetical protein
MRTTRVLCTSVVVTALTAAPAAAQAPPSSEAGATAAQVDGVATVSGTSASTAESGSADATVIGLGGETVVGGAQEGPGEQSGEIVTIGEDSEQGFLTVGGWDTTVEEDRSTARTAVVEGNLGGEEGGSLTVLESESTAERDGSEASTTGVRLRLSDHEVELLHAHTSSTGEGASYVASINGERILSNEDAGGSCEIPADPLLHLLCLYAEAIAEDADGATGGKAGVADVTGLDGNLAGRLFDTVATAGPAGEAETRTPAGGDDPTPAPAGDPEPGGPLPRTGAGLLPGLLGLLAMGLGDRLRRVGRREQPAAPR